MLPESKNVIGYRASYVLTSSGLLEDAVVIVNTNGRIESITNYSDDLNISIVDYTGHYILPGLIDSHTHGAMSFDTMDAAHHSLNEMSKYLASRGVVAFTPTTVTASDEETLAALKQVRDSKYSGVDGAEILGTFLEGPFLGYENRGAHPPNLLQKIDLEKMQYWIDESDQTICAVALAPELENSQSLVDLLHSNNINSMLAHTSAGYNCCKSLLDNNATGVVHCFNGMTGLHHREPGAVGAALTHDKAYVELIADGEHVHKAAVDISYRCCGENRLVLISDSMRATGMTDGQYMLGQMKVSVVDGVCRTESGGLAGSTLALDRAVNNVAQMLTRDCVEVWTRASYTPANMLKVNNDLGSLSPGKKASFVVAAVGGTVEVLATVVNGNVVYENSKEKQCI